MLCFFLAACSEEIEPPNPELGHDYQPLVVGIFWIYQVEETIYYGENDSEDSQFFYRDLIRSSYLNAENEVVYIVARFKSPDRMDWSFELEYSMVYRDQALLRTVQNTPLVALVFPPEQGKVWNGKIYQVEGNDDFEIVQVGTSSIPGFETVEIVKVRQEELDDNITIRDIRYEVFGKGIGLVEKYDEVLTYCSRNDCLGDQLIDGGSKTHLTLVEYGQD
ncbi:hypothetical protein GCM10027454_22450 [Algoriphagus aestuariicola]